MAKERCGYVFRDNVGRWYARVTFTNEQGRRRDIKRRAASEKAARKTLAAILREMDEHGASTFDAQSMTFLELADYFEEHYLTPAEYVGERKISGVRSIVTAKAELKALREHFGKRKLRSITYGDLRSFRSLRLKTPTRYETQRSITAVNRELSKLRRMLNVAQREGWIIKNPFTCGDSLICLADEKHRERVLTRKEEARLFAAIEAEPKRSHLKGILLMALDCALRRGEILTLKWYDVNLEKRTVTVRAFNTKTARSRTVALTTRAYQELEKLWQASKRDLDAFVFGVRVTIKTAWAKACKSASIYDFHFHDCRHTAISRMIRAGLPPVEVMRVSGHTTMSAFYRYANLDPDTVFRAAAALDAYHAQGEQSGETSQLVN